jgi:hypothetical protein
MECSRSPPSRRIIDRPVGLGKREDPGPDVDTRARPFLRLSSPVRRVGAAERSSRTMPKKTILVVAAVALAVAPCVRAQEKSAAKSREDMDKLVELVRKDVRKDKADIIAKTMEFDSTQSAAFWPVYKQYEAEMQSLGDERLAVIQDLAEHFDSLNDAKAKGLLERSLNVEQKRIAVQMRYKDELLKVLPAKVVARFFQVDSRLNNLINLEVSSQIPLVY